MGATVPDLRALPELSDREFALFQALIHREAGIHLTAVKKPLLIGRLGRRVRELSLPSFGAYYRRVNESLEERLRMLDRVSTNKTHFFREPAHFRFLEQVVIPSWTAPPVRPRRIRAWSAGCSTGEEAYSLAAVLLAHLPGEDWQVEILATDISTRVLEKGRSAVWPVAKADEIPERYRRGHFLRGHGSQAGLMKAGPALRQAVRLERRNLVDEGEHPAGPFDLILCRNVLIYFDPSTKARVLGALLRRLAPRGYLFLGHSESLHWLYRSTRSVGPTVYQLAVDEQP